MDLRTIKEDLLGGNYESPLDFCKDMKLIFQNSRNYNTNKRSRVSLLWGCNAKRNGPCNWVRASPLLGANQFATAGQS